MGLNAKGEKQYCGNNKDWADFNDGAVTEEEIMDDYYEDIEGDKEQTYPEDIVPSEEDK